MAQPPVAARHLLQEMIPDLDVGENHTASTAIRVLDSSVCGTRDSRKLTDSDGLSRSTTRDQMWAIMPTGNLQFVGELKAPWVDDHLLRLWKMTAIFAIPEVSL